MATKLTKAQLLARINELERDLAAELQAARPSRAAQRSLLDDPENTRTRRYKTRDGRVIEKSTVYVGQRQVTRSHEVQS